MLTDPMLGFGAKLAGATGNVNAPDAVAPPSADPNATYGWAWAPPSHLEGEPAVPMPSAPPGLDTPANVPFTLPNGTVGLRMTVGEHNRLQTLEREARAARIARDQAVRDAQMLDAMMRTAKSTKDIEVALQQQDMIGFRNAVASGTPAFQALQRFPRAATAPLVAAMTASQNVPTPSVLRLPGMPAGVRSGRYGERFSFPPAPPVASQPPQARTGQPVRDAQGTIIGTDVGGGRIIPTPKPAEEGKLTDVQNKQIAGIDAEIAAVNRAIAGKKLTDPRYVDGVNRLGVLQAERDTILQGDAMRLKPRIKVRRKRDGKVFTYPGVASEVPLSEYEVLP